MSKFVSFLKDETGASAAEYVLILALVGLAIVAGAGLLGTKMDAAMSAAANKMVVPS